MNNNYTQRGASSPTTAIEILRNSSMATREQNNVGTLTLSQGQRTELERFKQLFPTEKSVLDFFSPAKWEQALSHKDACLDYSMVTLHIIRLYYGESIAKQIVRNNLIGLYTVAKPHEFVNEQALNLATGLFLGKFAPELSVFGALYYFASYLTNYRTSYSAFDLQDVLRQCEVKFMPYWRGCIHRKNNATKDAVRAVETGRAALFTYLRREYVAKGRDIRESAIYKTGALAKEDVALVESMEPLAF